jgi:hypothetical protein
VCTSMIQAVSRRRRKEHMCVNGAAKRKQLITPPPLPPPHLIDGTWKMFRVSIFMLKNDIEYTIITIKMVAKRHH